LAVYLLRVIISLCTCYIIPVIFTVHGFVDGKNPYVPFTADIWPFLVIRGGKVGMAPYQDEPSRNFHPNEKTVREFLDSFLIPGAKFQLLRGGESVGSIILINERNTTKNGRYTSTYPFGLDDIALAVNWEGSGVGLHPTPEEKEVMDSFMREFKRKWINEEELHENFLGAFDIDGDGRVELINAASYEDSGFIRIYKINNKSWVKWMEVREPLKETLPSGESGGVGK
jgi:hypothetical protein